jgi:hypothetical protein
MSAVQVRFMVSPTLISKPIGQPVTVGTMGGSESELNIVQDEYHI